MNPRIYWCKYKKAIIPPPKRFTKWCGGCNVGYCARCDKLIRFKNIDSFLNWGNAGSGKKREWNIKKLNEAYNRIQSLYRKKARRKRGRNWQYGKRLRKQ